MYCHYCGAKIEDTAKYCSNCGSAVAVSFRPENGREQSGREQTNDNNKKIVMISLAVILVSLLAVLTVLFLRGVCLNHEWRKATCTEPKTCIKCGKTKGYALGHKWEDATCTEPKTCSVCGATEGEALGHKWIEATYRAPKTCSVCGETEGDPLPFYNGRGFLLSSNDFAELLNDTLTTLCEEDGHKTEVGSFSLRSSSKIAILRDGDQSFVFLNLESGNSLENPISQVTLFVDYDKLMNNYTSYRTTIINILASLPITLDNTINDYDQGFQFVVDIFNMATEKDFSYGGGSTGHTFITGALPVSVKRNGLTYTLSRDVNNVLFTVSVGAPKPFNVSPVTDNDFIYSCDAGSNRDMLSEIKRGMHIQGLYYDPIEDNSREGVITTARGIHLGDSKALVISLYGTEYIEHSDITNEFIYSKLKSSCKALMRTNAVSHIHYFTPTNNCLTFCFDENDQVSWIIFTDSSVSEKLRY